MANEAAPKKRARAPDAPPDPDEPRHAFGTPRGHAPFASAEWLGERSRQWRQLVRDKQVRAGGPIETERPGIFCFAALQQNADGSVGLSLATARLATPELLPAKRRCRKVTATLAIPLTLPPTLALTLMSSAADEWRYVLRCFVCTGGAGGWGSGGLEQLSCGVIARGVRICRAACHSLPRESSPTPP